MGITWGLVCGICLPLALKIVQPLQGEAAIGAYVAQSAPTRVDMGEAL